MARMAGADQTNNQQQQAQMRDNKFIAGPNLTTTFRPRTEGWFVLVIISTCHSVDADFHVLHARIMHPSGDELLCCFAADKVAYAFLWPLTFLVGCEGPGAEFLQELTSRTIGRIERSQTYANKCMQAVYKMFACKSRSMCLWETRNNELHHSRIGRCENTKRECVRHLFQRTAIYSSFVIAFVAKATWMKSQQWSNRCFELHSWWRLERCG